MPLREITLRREFRLPGESVPLREIMWPSRILLQRGTMLLGGTMPPREIGLLKEIVPPRLKLLEKSMPVSPTALTPLEEL